MKNWMIDILALGVGFAAGAYFMHVRMRKEYEKVRCASTLLIRFLD